MQEKFNIRLKQAMDLRLMTQSELCSITGIPKSAMSQYISGNFKPKQKRTYLLAKALNVNEAWLMGFNDVSMERNNTQDEINDQNISSIDMHLSKYNQLNTLGQKKTDEYIDDLLENPKYTKTDEASKPSKALNMIPKVDLQGKIYRAARSVDDAPPQIIDYDEQLKEDMKNAKKVTKLEDL